MRRDFKSKGLEIVAFSPQPDKGGSVRNYLKRQHFEFTTLAGKVQNGGMPFGISIIGSAVLFGADGRVAWRAVKLDVTEARKALEKLPDSK